MDSCGEYFFFYGLTDFVIFSYGLKAWLLLVRAIFRFLLPGVLGFTFRPPRALSNNCFSYHLFPPTGRSSHFRLRVLANHFASTFFLPLSGDLSELLYVTPYPILYTSGHQVQTSVFPFWPGFVTLELTHILYCLNGHSLMACQFKHEDSRNLISIFSVGDHVTTLTEFPVVRKITTKSNGNKSIFPFNITLFY